MQITMVGSGYVGLVSGACFAQIGHNVTCVDKDEKKITKLKDGIAPIYEPGIEGIIRQNHELDRIKFTSDLGSALKNCDMAFIAVGTPPGENGEADLSYVESVAAEIGQLAQKNLIVVIKSTVPVGTGQKVEDIIKNKILQRDLDLSIHVASNPEFLKEGTAISDFMKPDRIIVGLSDFNVTEAFKELYRPFLLEDPSKLLIVERSASELIKYSSNAMLATRISFMNELSKLCEKLEVDIDQVRLGMGTDARIGKKFLYAGPGFGGSCFPKDVTALIKTGQENDCELTILQSVTAVNMKQKEYVANKIKTYFGDLKDKKICIWGLSFKPGTDDIREAPAITVINKLLTWGAKVVAHDPQAIESFATQFPSSKNLSFSAKAYQALESADALVLLTEWREYRWPKWEHVSTLLKRKVVFDFRNQYDSAQLNKLGFYYECVGRKDSKINKTSVKNNSIELNPPYVQQAQTLQQ